MTTTHEITAQRKQARTSHLHAIANWSHRALRRHITRWMKTHEQALDAYWRTVHVVNRRQLASLDSEQLTVLRHVYLSYAATLAQSNWLVIHGVRWLESLIDDHSLARQIGLCKETLIEYLGKDFVETMPGDFRLL